jgi:polar amino acid transport system substrate-binding protein
MKKIALLVSLSLVAVIGFSALCNAASTLETVKNRGKLIAGVRYDNPPFGYIDKAGNVAGFDFDVAEYIAERLDVKLEVREVTSKTRVPLLVNGTIDVLVASFGHIRKRDEVVDFSIDYLPTMLRFLVKKGSGIKSHEDLEGKTLIVLHGTPQGKELQKYVKNLELLVLQDYPQCVMALKKGKGDALFTDELIIHGLLKDNPDLEMVGRAPFEVPGLGLAVRENDSDWRDFINFCLQDMWEDGTYREVYKKHFGKEPASEFRMPRWTF